MLFAVDCIIFGFDGQELKLLVIKRSFEPEKGLQESKDACAGVPTHYHETNSASSQLAPAWACAVVELLRGKSTDIPACAGRRNQTLH